MIHEPTVMVVTSRDWQTNTYLVMSTSGDDAVLIDCGGPLDPLLEELADQGPRLHAVLVTHRHEDHTEALAALRAVAPDVAVLGHADELESIPDARHITQGDVLAFGDLSVGVLGLRGHTSGHLGYRVANNVFVGDVLYRGSVGGVRSEGHTTFSDLRSAVMDVLMELPAETTVRPGHGRPTTVALEQAQNPFVLAWRGAAPAHGGACSSNGRPGHLVVLADDYDGLKKAWVRWDDGEDDLVAGSVLD